MTENKAKKFKIRTDIIRLIYQSAKFFARKNAIV